MKKLFLLFAFATIMVGTSYGQKVNEDFREGFSFGIKAGTNISNVYDSKGEEFNADSKMGLAAGVFLSVPLGRYFGIQPEILFSQKGYKGSGSILGSEYDYKYTTSFIDIPLLFAFKPVSMITIVAGPQYSFLVKDKYNFNSAIVDVEQENEFENDNIRKNILSFLGGVDVNLNRIVLGTRVGWDLQDNKGDGTSETPRYKNVWFQLTFGLRF